MVAARGHAMNILRLVVWQGEHLCRMIQICGAHAIDIHRQEYQNYPPRILSLMSIIILIQFV